MGATLAGDVVNSAASFIKTGEVEWKGSSIQTYVGAAAGGFAQGVALGITGVAGAPAAGAIGAAVESFTTNSLNMMTGVEGYREQDGYNRANLLLDTAMSGVQGATAGYLFDQASKIIKIPGITKRIGSAGHTYQSVVKMNITKLANSNIKNWSIKTLYKGLISYGVVGTVDKILVKGQKKLKELTEDLAKDKMSDLYETIAGQNGTSQQIHSQVCPPELYAGNTLPACAST